MGNEDFKERVRRFAASKGMTINEFQDKIGVSNSYIHNVGSISPRIGKKILQVFPDANIEYLNSGVGEMSFGEIGMGSIATSTVPLLPVYAVAGQLSDFVNSVQQFDCERIISPVADVSFAMHVTGDSKSPEYTDGSIVFVQRINELAFIEWGRTFVLDTINGTVIKKVFPSQNGDDKVECRSVNPNYAPFEIRKQDIYGWFIVRLQMSKK